MFLLEGGNKMEGYCRSMYFYGKKDKMRLRFFPNTKEHGEFFSFKISESLSIIIDQKDAADFFRKLKEESEKYWKDDQFKQGVENE